MGSSRSDFLFSTPTFWIGVGSSVAIGGNYYDFNRSRTPVEADCRALASDFGATGLDIMEAARSIYLEPTLNEQEVTEKKAANGQE